MVLTLNKRRPSKPIFFLQDHVRIAPHLYSLAIFICLGKMKFPAFPFPEFESVQTIKLASSKITFVVLFSTIRIYSSFVS